MSKQYVMPAQSEGGSGVDKILGDDLKLYRNFRKRSKTRFHIVFRGVERFPGFVNRNATGDRGFNYSRLFLFGEKARQAVGGGNDEVHGRPQGWINLQSTNVEEVKRLLAELNSRFGEWANDVPLKDRHVLDETTIVSCFQAWPEQQQRHFRNVLVFMIHTLGRRHGRSFADGSVFVSTSQSRKVAYTFARGQDGQQSRYLLIEYWLPSDYHNMALTSKVMLNYSNLLPSAWPYETEKEVSVLGGLFPHSIIEVEEYRDNELLRVVVNPHLLERLRENAWYALPEHARVPINQDNFEDRMLAETNYRTAYWSWLNSNVLNIRVNGAAETAA